MKKWELPVLEEILVSETAYGYKESPKFDQYLYDENGALHVNFGEPS